MRTTLLIAALLTGTVSAAAQSTKPARLNEDYTWNTAAATPRPLHYRPAGNGAETTDGTARFNRALYGAHTGFRLECSDMPEFGLYLPRMGGNLRIDIPHEHCTARYEAGRMIYRLDERVEIEAQVLRSEDAALWRLTNTGDEAVHAALRYGGAADVKFYREGDLGVDKPDCFDFKPAYCAGNVYTVDGCTAEVEYGRKTRAKLRLTLPTDEIVISEHPALQASLTLAPGETRYMAVYPATTRADLGPEALAARFAEAETQRAELAGALTIRTPDPYITPIGEALALAADGLWSGEVWLHGAVGWRAPYSGWRGAYVGDALGWHERARTHFDTYAANQATGTPPLYAHPRQDSTLNLARAEKRWGTPMYSDGYIARRPGKKEEMSHYDMNLCYIDELLRHLAWTGDRDYARRIFPVIDRHLKWEKRNFDPDGDHLYDAYCCIWASDALYYTGGAVTHSTAYNYYANRQAARIAEAIGLDPAPYRDEADAILEALRRELWLPDKGHWAEYRDKMGHRRLHENAAVWTVYHAIDSETADPFEAWTATEYVERRIPRIPVVSPDLEEGYAVISTTNWKPYSWSINNVAIAEMMHTALAYWQADRPEEAFRLMKSVALDNMYLGASPLNFGQISRYDAARGECYRDFGDPVGVWSRALVEGLYGIRPDLFGGRVELRPGFPAEWDEASVEMADLSYSMHRDAHGVRYSVENRFPAGTRIELVVPASVNGVKQVTINGRRAAWRSVENSIGQPRIRIDAGDAPNLEIEIAWLPARKHRMKTGIGATRTAGPVDFERMERANVVWWQPKYREEAAAPTPDNGFDDIRSEACRTVEVPFNASVTDIFRNRYLSPRPDCTTLQIPVQGIGEWCHPKQTAEIDDSGLRALAGERGTIDTSLGIPFRTPAEGPNILYTSLWDNYPTTAAVPLEGRASHAYLLLAGSTNHMQYDIANGLVAVEYADGTEQQLELVNPLNWAPIEQDFYFDEGAFALPEGVLPPYRLHLGSGRVSRRLGDELGIEGVYGRQIDGGAATLVDLRLDPAKELRRLRLETLSNDVVIGLMAVTLQSE